MNLQILDRNFELKKLSKKPRKTIFKRIQGFLIFLTKKSGTGSSAIEKNHEISDQRKHWNNKQKKNKSELIINKNNSK